MQQICRIRQTDNSDYRQTDINRQQLVLRHLNDIDHMHYKRPTIGIRQQLDNYAFYYCLEMTECDNVIDTSIGAGAFLFSTDINRQIYE